MPRQPDCILNFDGLRSSQLRKETYLRLRNCLIEVEFKDLASVEKDRLDTVAIVFIHPPVHPPRQRRYVDNQGQLSESGLYLPGRRFLIFFGPWCWLTGCTLQSLIH